MPAPVELKAWGKSAIYALLIFIFFSWYSYAYFGSFSLTAISSVFATTSAILIGTSFALSGFGYFFDFLDKEVYERKYIGLLGYYLALIYTLMLPFVNPDIYWYGIPKYIFSADYILGISAMIILTMMAVISTKKMMIRIGPQRWRHLLQLGYFAYALLIIRAIIIESQVWNVWLWNMKGLPPPRLVITVFALLVVVLRIAVSISKIIITPHPEQTEAQHR